MSAKPAIKIYDQLSVKLGKETAEGLTTFFDDQIKDDLESKLKNLATKDDINSIKIEFTNLINSTKNELSDKIKDSKIETIRWAFAFFIGYAIVSLGTSLINILKK